jgi:solute carrier family 25 2-oxodicarboxylate transporter 21
MSSTASPTTLTYAGGIAGVVEAITIQPLEFIKVRFQLNTGANGSILRGVRDVIAEGGFFRLYRGLLPELTGMFPTRSAMYASNEMAKRVLLNSQERTEETALIAGTAGFMSGIAEAVVANPFQIIKVRLNSKQHLGRYKNSFDCVKTVLREEGIVAFAIGLQSTMLRNSIWNGVYFTTMFCIKERQFLSGKDQSKLQSTLSSLLTGFLGGVTATVFNAPFDVLKSRIQGQDHKNVKYNSTLDALDKIAKTEGVMGLYKGFAPKALRMGIGGAVAVTTFEAVCKIAKGFDL